MKKLEGGDALVMEAEDAEALAERIRAVAAGRQRRSTDIGNPSQAKAFVDAAVKEFGQLDILANNARGNEYEQP
jgi:NAD(P)-dependent dehydrogenase (short-subunit alcohol dehydrogenase family)